MVVNVVGIIIPSLAPRRDQCLSGKVDDMCKASVRDDVSDGAAHRRCKDMSTIALLLDASQDSPVDIPHSPRLIFVVGTPPLM